MEETAQIGYTHSCAAATGFDEVSENHCSASKLLSGRKCDLEDTSTKGIKRYHVRDELSFNGLSFTEIFSFTFLIAKTFSFLVFALFSKVLFLLQCKNHLTTISQ